MKNWLKTTFSTYVCPVLRWLSRIINWLQNHVMHILVIILVGMIVCLLALGFGIDNNTPISILGTQNKKEALEFIAFGMGGVVAAIVAAAVNRRAAAQEKNNDNEQFKSAMENLGHKDASVRIAAFYLFYHLAKGKEEDFRHNVFDILCSCLRSMPPERSHLIEDKKKRPTTECQTLLNILFNSDDESVFAKFKADLRQSYLVHIELINGTFSNANCSDVNLSNAMLIYTNFSNANFLRANLSSAILMRANLSNANLLNANLASAPLPHANLSGANLIQANLSNAILEDADLSGASVLGVNLSGAILRGAQLKDVRLMDVDSIKDADFCKAKIRDRPITKDDIPADKGEYYADWNLPPWNDEWPWNMPKKE